MLYSLLAFTQNDATIRRVSIPRTDLNASLTKEGQRRMTGTGSRYATPLSTTEQAETWDGQTKL